MFIHLISSVYLHLTSSLYIAMSLSFKKLFFFRVRGREFYYNANKCNKVEHNITSETGHLLPSNGQWRKPLIMRKLLRIPSANELLSKSVYPHISLTARRTILSKNLDGNFSLSFQILPNLRDHTTQLTGIFNVLRQLSSLNEQKRKVLSLRT